MRDDLSKVSTQNLPPWECCGAVGQHRRNCAHHPDERKLAAEAEAESAVYCSEPFPHPELTRAPCVRGDGHEGAHRTALGRVWGIGREAGE